MDVSILIPIATAVVLFASAISDIKKREASDVYWLILFIFGIISMFMKPFTNNILGSLVASISIALIALDLLWDRPASTVIEIIIYTSSVIAIILSFILLDGDAVKAYVSIPVMYVLMLALYYSGAIKGGADAKCIVAIAASTCVYSPLLNLINIPVASYLFPPALAVLLLSAILSLLVVPYCLMKNIRDKNVKFPICLFGYSMDIEKAEKKFVWPLTRVVDNEIKETLHPWDDEDALEILKKKGLKTIKITPIIPFLVPITIAYVIVIVIGNPLFILF